MGAEEGQDIYIYISLYLGGGVRLIRFPLGRFANVAPFVQSQQFQQFQYLLLSVWRVHVHFSFLGSLSGDDVIVWHLGSCSMYTPPR